VRRTRNLDLAASLTRRRYDFALPFPTVFGRVRRSDQAKTGPSHDTEVIEEGKFPYKTGKIGSPENKLPRPAPVAWYLPALSSQQSVGNGWPAADTSSATRESRSDANQAVSQVENLLGWIMVGPNGLEPSTSSVSILYPRRNGTIRS